MPEESRPRHHPVRFGRGHRRLRPLEDKWAVLAIISFGGFLSIMDGGMVAIGFPAMVQAFHTDLNTLVWVTLAHNLASAAPLLVLGWVADACGRKQMYLWGVLVVALGLALSPISQTVTQLILVRLGAGVGAAMMLATDNALITQAFPAQERGKAQGIMNAAFGLGIGLGYLVGGVLVDGLDWQALFWTRLPLQLLLALLVWRLIPDEPAQESSGPFQGDYAGALVLTAMMVAGLLAINRAGRWGIASPRVIALLLAPAVLLPVLICIERRAPRPVVELRLFANRVFSSGVAAQTFVQLAHRGWNFLAPFYLLHGVGRSASVAGLMLLPFHASRLLLSPVSGILSDRLGTRIPAALGHILFVGGLLALSRVGFPAPPWQIVLAIAVAGAGLSLFLPANNSAIMGSVPRQYLSSASGFLGISRTLGASTGAALSGALFATWTASHAASLAGQGSMGAEQASRVAVAAFSDTITVIAAVSALGIVAIYLRGRA